MEVSLFLQSNDGFAPHHLTCREQGQQPNWPVVYQFGWHPTALTIDILTLR